ncbi:MAG: ComEC/Rec2 family competence protein [Deltaproteobacteria bacterium]|nr:ComEC/Rec2 family competence protein [Deltaproteobacteria bacterium]MBW2135618.1 ComEC/Rec2 family competence protein [Deltaproteobacteria bacterium]
MNLAGPIARPLVPLTLALIGGIASPAWGIDFSYRWAAGASLFILLGLGLAWFYGRSCRGLSLVLFWLIGLASYQLALNPPLPANHVCHLPADSAISLIGRIDQPPKALASGWRFELEADSWLGPQGWQATTGRVQVYAPLMPKALRVGERVAILVRLRPVENFLNPGSFDRRRFLARQQIFTAATLKESQHLVRLAPSREPWWPSQWIIRFRARATDFLEQQPQPSRALFKALLLGDQGEITPEMRQAFSRTGTSHLIAISGLHLGMVAAVAFGLFFWLLRRSVWLLLRVNAIKIAALAAIIPVWGYGLIAGGSPATQRAEIMILVYLLLVLLDRHRDLYSALALAALVILTLSPLTLFTVSFQLSFISVLGLIYLTPKWAPSLKAWWYEGELPRGLRRRLAFWIGDALAASGAATLATLPLVAASFNLVPTYGVLVNLVAIPLFSTLTVPLGLAALVLLPWSSGLAQPLISLGNLLLKAGIWVIFQGARLPLSSLTVPTPTPLQIGAFYLLVFGLFPRRRNFWSWASVGLSALLLMGSIGYQALSLRIKSNLEITSLDTRGEMAALATLPGGTRMVISGGVPTCGDFARGSRSLLTSFLHYCQVSQVDYLVALATTRQNAGTLLTVAQNFTLGQFWYEGGRVPDPAFWELRNMLGDQRLPVLNLAIKPPPAEIQGIEIRLFQESRWPGGRSHGPVVLQLGYKNQRLLFIPPARREWLGRLADFGTALASEVVWAPRRLTDSKFWGTLLPYLHPQVVVVSGGSGEKEPGKQDGLGTIKWYYTDQGAVTAVVSDSGLTMRQWRP